ncbi:acid protease [Athelia psychrophila]|uniref:Acid protease n=1 Tax=Athelia psychrophila TaxID=1759441 RepID=A0A166MA12_9AGAM|nr:acid protease [Fibularhizoctonia sp. CBS 109695]
MWSTPGVLALLAVSQALCAFGSSIHIPLQRDEIPTARRYKRALQSRYLANGSGIELASISEDKQSYYAIIRTGNINFRVALDTGSSDLWLLSSDCEASTCSKLPRYPLKYQSPTFASVGANDTVFSTHFADGTGASGFVARESVTFANLTLPNQAFALVNASNVTLNDNISGVLGLGFPRLSSISNTVVNATPFFPTLAAQGVLDYPLFGVSLTRNESGTLNIGAIDSSVVTNASKIVWNEVVPFAPSANQGNSSSYLQWVIRLSSFTLNVTGFLPIPTYPTITKNASLALFDIGASGIYGPFQDVARLFGAIDGSRLVDASGTWAVPCALSQNMTFGFGGYNFTLQPSDYLIGVTESDPSYCISWPMASPPSSDGVDWQFGTAFLRTVYSVFNYGINNAEAPRIGLYPLASPNATVESAAQIAAFLSSQSATIATTLPNIAIATPTYTTPPYTFNASITASAGQIVSTGLGAAAYTPLIGGKRPNVTALPQVFGVPNGATLVITDSSGTLQTITTAAQQPSITLGNPPGWSSSARPSHILTPSTVVSSLVLIFTFALAPNFLL